MPAEDFLKKSKNIPHGGLWDERFCIIIIPTTMVVIKKTNSLKLYFGGWSLSLRKYKNSAITS